MTCSLGPENHREAWDKENACLCLTFLKESVRELKIKVWVKAGERLAKQSS